MLAARAAARVPAHEHLGLQQWPPRHVGADDGEAVREARSLEAGEVVLPRLPRRRPPVEDGEVGHAAAASSPARGT